jgi:deoxyribonuclease-4
LREASAPREAGGASQLRIGAHVSIADGVTGAVRTALSLGGNTFQFFTRNPRGGGAKALDPADLERGLTLAARHDVLPVAHAPYTVNLISAKPEVRSFARRTVAEDLERAGAMGSPFLVLHPGSHQGAGVEAGLKMLVDQLRPILDAPGDTQLLLETMAGSGSEVGFALEQLASVLEGTGAPSRLGVCGDTCHLWAAGYELAGEGLDRFLDRLDAVIGVKRLRAFHLNDSRFGRGSHKDRHAGLGEGEMGLDLLRGVVCHPRLAGVPFLLETPQDLDGYRREIALVKSFCPG